MYYAEDGLDKYIRDTFFSNTNNDCVMVEVGAGPPVFYSMSKHFRDSGWRCVCVEPNPKFVAQHKEVGNEIHNYACSNENKTANFTTVLTNWNAEVDGISYSALEGRYPQPEKYATESYTVNVIKLDDLLKNIKVNKVDLISVDTEGWEVEVMQGFSVDVYKPKVVVLENYLHSKTYTEYMHSVGYVEHTVIRHNYIYVKA